MNAKYVAEVLSLGFERGFATKPHEFAKLWQVARKAAQEAALERHQQLVDGQIFDGGFAWISLPANTSFAKWARTHDRFGNPEPENHRHWRSLAGRDFPKGISIWYSELHEIATQSVGVHEAAVQAARNVLAHGLQSSEVRASSRLDSH